MTSTLGRFLLDTNIAIALLNGETAARTNLQFAVEAFLPAIVLGELFYGAAKSDRGQENIRKIESLAAERKVLDCSIGVAREYGQIRQELRRKGRPIPENDVWIAATARHFGLTLVTRDHHFREIEGLQTADWATPLPSNIAPQ